MKPGFFTNDVLAEVPPLGRLLFQGLWCLADRAGRLEDRPKKIKAEVLPYDDCDVDALLHALAERGFILRYKHGRAAYIQILAFSKHQNPHCKEPDSIIPAPGEHSTIQVLNTISAPDKPDSGPADSLLLIPDSGFPIPDPGLLIPDSPSKDSCAEASPAARRNGAQRPDRGNAPTAAAWAAYSAAYRSRYGAEPTRNAHVNGQLAQFITRVPSEEAPAIAEFYVGMNKAFYVSQQHPVGLLLKDAEGIRTQWLNGRVVTDTEARQADRTQSNYNAFAPLLAEAQERENADVEAK